VISVVTIVKDDLHGFIRTRQSLEQQSFDIWEHIVVPASAGDSVSLYLRDLRHERTTIRVQEGRGIYPAMNQGLAAATQEFVVFLNAGDLFATENTLDIVSGHLVNENPDWCIFGGYVERGNGRIVVHPVPNPQPWLVGVGKANIMHPSVYYRRNFLHSLGGYNESYSIAADLELNMRALAAARPIVTDMPVSVFFADGVSSTQVFRSLNEARRARSAVLGTSPLTVAASVMWFGYQLVRAAAAKSLSGAFQSRR
jgi:glycosyltransferase involved in cell wall biosynthesis